GAVEIVAVAKLRQHQSEVAKALLVHTVTRLAQHQREAVRPLFHHLLMFRPTRGHRKRDAGPPTPDHLCANRLGRLLVVGDAGVPFPELGQAADRALESLHILPQLAQNHERAVSGKVRRLGRNRKLLTLVDLTENELAGLDGRPALVTLVAAFSDLATPDHRE